MDQFQEQCSQIIVWAIDIDDFAMIYFFGLNCFNLGNLIIVLVFHRNSGENQYKKVKTCLTILIKVEMKV